MKRTILRRLLLPLLLLVALLSHTSPASAVKYRGFADVTGGPPISESEVYLNITTTHGVQLSRIFYFGVGGGLNIGYDLTCGEIFLRPRVDIPVANSRWMPYVQVEPGVSFGEDSGFYGNLGAGVRYAITSKLGLNLGLAFSYFGNREDDYLAKMAIDGYLLGVNVGIDF